MGWLFSLLLLLPPALFADGGLFPPPYPGIELWERNQLAVLRHSGGIEDLSIVVRFEGDTNDFAWIIPAPSQPSVDSISVEVFDELAYLSRPVYRDRGMGCGCWEDRRRPMGPGGYDGREGGNGALDDGVDIVGEGTVGLLDYLILHATNPVVLKDSLESWGYEYPDEAELLFRYYIEKEWEYFVAARVDTSEVRGSYGYYYGNIPVKLSFQCAEPVYPMKISSLSSEGTELILYVVADHRMTFDEATLKYSERIDDEELNLIRDDYPHLVQLFQGTRFVTKLERWFEEDEMEDIVLERAPDDQEFREIIFTGVPGDGLILASLVCLIALWSIRGERTKRRMHRHLMS